jgi:hypothetical protein
MHDQTTDKPPQFHPNGTAAMQSVKHFPHIVRAKPGVPFLPQWLRVSSAVSSAMQYRFSDHSFHSCCDFLCSRQENDTGAQNY